MTAAASAAIWAMRAAAGDEGDRDRQRAARRRSSTVCSQSSPGSWPQTLNGELAVELALDRAVPEGRQAGVDRGMGEHQRRDGGERERERGARGAGRATASDPRRRPDSLSASPRSPAA